MSMHTCHEDGCDQRASDRCFECGVWRCETHLVAISLPTFASFFAETLCSACLQNHISHPDPYGQIVIQITPSVASSALV